MRPKILIIGASGFIGANLLRAFEEKDIPVKAMSRSPDKMNLGKNGFPVKADLEDPESLKKALEGVETIYYLAHSLDRPGDEFMEREKIQALNLAGLLNESHRLIYLGGIVAHEQLSPHLESRRAVGEVFRKTKAKTIEFRASIVIGRGGASFEMIRALVNRLPFVVTAEWSKSICQPIAVKDVISYLLLSKDAKFKKKRLIFDIGGPDRLEYGELLTLYAKEAGLFRPKLHLASFPKTLAKELLKVVVPEYYEVGSKLLDSIEHNTVTENDDALREFDFAPMGYREALALAKDPELKETNFAETLKKLKDHSELPKYLAGQTLQKRFEAPEAAKILESVIEKVSGHLPFPLESLKKEEYSVKVPFVGQIKLLSDAEGLLLCYQPKYFFQATGWALFEKVAGEARKMIKTYRSKAYKS